MTPAEEWEGCAMQDDGWRGRLVADLATTTPLTAEQARGFVEASRSEGEARGKVRCALAIGHRTIAALEEAFFWFA